MHTIDDIIIKLYTEADKDSFIDLFMNEEICKYMAGGAFDKEKDAEKLFYYLKELSEHENSAKKAYAIFKADEYIGHFETELKNNEIEIVYVLHQAFWGKAIMHKVISFFNEWYRQNLTARVMPSNSNSIKLLEKIGIERKVLTKFNNQKVIKYTLSKN